MQVRVLSTHLLRLVIVTDVKLCLCVYWLKAKGFPLSKNKLTSEGKNMLNADGLIDTESRQCEIEILVQCS